MLKRECDLNYSLIAIRSEIEDYKFAYFLNKSPFFLFRRMDKDIKYIINEKNIYFSAFEDVNTGLKRESFLIKNRALYSSELINNENLFVNNAISNTVFLIPELKEFDYLLKLIGIWRDEETAGLKKYLHNMTNIESEISINLNTIKSINNLVL